MRWPTARGAGDGGAAACRGAQGRIHHRSAAAPWRAREAEAQAPMQRRSDRWVSIALSVLLHAVLLAAAGVRLVAVPPAAAAGADAGDRGDGGGRARVAGMAQPTPHPPRRRRAAAPRAAGGGRAAAADAGGAGAARGRSGKRPQPQAAASTGGRRPRKPQPRRSNRKRSAAEDERKGAGAKQGRRRSKAAGSSAAAAARRSAGGRARGGSASAVLRPRSTLDACASAARLRAGIADHREDHPRVAASANRAAGFRM